MAKRALKQPDLRQHVERLTSNIARAHNLVSIYKLLAGSAPGRRSVGDTDVPRSAVVLLHASLEDFLRSLARSLFPTAGADVIRSIPLKGGRSERFSLVDLDRHRGKTVDDLIAESIADYLDRSSYNSATEIAGLLTTMGLDVEPVRRFFAELDRMMTRRHQIVHRADCTSEKGRGRHRAQSLRVATVERWINVVSNFQGAVLYQIELAQREAENAGIQ